MPDNSSHGPGHDIGGESGAVRQRQRMGQGGGAMSGGNFGVESMAEGNASGGQSHGAHMPHDGVTLHDHHRAGPPSLHQGAGAMDATAHSHHGPHHHHGPHAPEGTRPHHVGGNHSTRGKR